jgi:hypothetical protein
MDLRLVLEGIYSIWYELFGLSNKERVYDGVNFIDYLFGVWEKPIPGETKGAVL